MIVCIFRLHAHFVLHIDLSLGLRVDIHLDPRLGLLLALPIDARLDTHVDLQCDLCIDRRRGLQFDLHLGLHIDQYVVIFWLSTLTRAWFPSAFFSAWSP